MINLPSTDDFRKSTSHVISTSNYALMQKFIKFKAEVKSRGAIREIDKALDAYHLAKRSNQIKAECAALYVLIKQCKIWIKNKEGKMTGSTPLRRRSIIDLQRDAYQNLIELKPALESFNQRKAVPPVVQLRAMTGVYQHEREVYLKNKKQVVFSATRMHNNFNGNFSGLSETEFINLGKDLQKQRIDINMLYLNKLDRLDYMVDVEDGLFHDATGDVLSTHNGKKTIGFKNTVWIYAVDEYGNFLTMEHQYVGGELLDTQVNHSSFTAGKAVICAGTWEIKDGRLLNMSNNSGHYKPSMENLRNALQLLHALGCDLSGVVVDFWAPADQPDKMWVTPYDGEALRSSAMLPAPLEPRTLVSC